MALSEDVSLGLLDVLQQLPRDVLASTLWAKVSTAQTAPASSSGSPGRPFRLVSRHSRLLADQLTRRLRLSLPKGDESEAALCSQAAFLGRQERLEQLTLDGDVRGGPDSDNTMDVAVMKTLLMGHAALRHLHTLQINALFDQVPSKAAGAAVQLFCPSLRNLVLHSGTHAAAFFVPLRGCSNLQQITLSSCYQLRGDICSALAALPGLRTLSLSGWMTPEVAALLAGFTGLRELHAGSVMLESFTLPQVRDLSSALGGLTQLTVLDAPHVGFANIEGHVEGLVAQLSSLRNLADLSFGGRASGLAGQGAMDAVLRLTALTRLSCPALSPDLHGTAGRMTQLRQLCISGPLCPAGLVTALQALLPLPSLREFHCTVRCSLCEDGAAEVAGGGADTTGARATAAWQAASALAKVSTLESVRLTILGPDGIRTTTERLYASQISGIVCALLLPLGPVLKHLSLRRLSPGTLEGAWPALCMAAGLEFLQVSECHLPGSRLLVAGQVLVALQRLEVTDCTGVSGDSAVALAGSRLKPLHVKWLPRLNAVQHRLFCEEAKAGVTLDE